MRVGPILAASFLVVFTPIALTQLHAVNNSVGAGRLDAKFFTTYAMGANNTTVTWDVGFADGYSESPRPQTGLGMLGPFGRVAALIEGRPVQDLKTGTVTRNIYIVDAANGAKSNEVALDIYQKVDVPSGGSGDEVTVTFVKTIVLPLTGGDSTVVSMAANDAFLFIGTNQDFQATEVNKTTLQVTDLNGISGLTLSGITVDNYGYATLSWGTGSETGFVIYGPFGELEEDGGGAPTGPPFMLNTYQAVIPSTLP